MTREGAIGNLIHAIRWNDMPKKEALDMAIQALKQEPICPSHGVDCEDCPAYKPQEPCDDAISRQAAIKAFKPRGIAEDVWQECNEYKMLSSLPPVNPQPKTGHWIKYSISRCGEQHYKCTSCGYYINFGKWGEIYTKKYKYCPNCGAKMVEPQESEE